MKFCDRCGNLMFVEKKRKAVLVCRKCGRRSPIKEKVTIAEIMHEPKKEVIVMGKDEGIAELPMTKIICPKCDHQEAHWWMQQTRAADEPPTLFYRCAKCSYSWRSYG